ncbi:carboxypeptidase-like regulatory domain-containing protein [Sulfuracidifex tepidarius]|uniref:Chromosome partition protein Smc n=1 Tax=Sulfuracidifex tepidarius TaxID=1294262 RepID=A0A510DV70_9CREN|nr:carboxypeptidase-like regulatory domain-containing protein [Sulfuracidifex tepidarius]BBG24101.1 Chromosome partition protein Smc [Sulfuracidifex tepidarius]BBG26856.1 Chromosome partition protein Smc [Sulfuracidifex tepidarius]
MKMNKIGLIMAIVAISFVFSSFTAMSMITGDGYTIYSPAQNNQIYQYGQSVVLSFTSPYKSSQFTVTIDRFIEVNGTLVAKLYNSIPEFTNSTGGFTGSIMTGDNPPGKYLIILNDPTYGDASVEFNITIVPPHYQQATISVTVENESNLPISGASVVVLNSTNDQQVNSGITSSTGTVDLTVPYFGTPVTYIVKASATGYVTQNTTVTVNSNTTFPVTLVLPNVGFSFTVQGIFQNGQSVAPANDRIINVYQGVPLTIEYNAIDDGVPASGAKITEMVTYPNGSIEQYTATVGSNGLVNITFTPPLSTSQTTLNMEISASASYSGMSASLPYVIYASAIYNYNATITQLQKEVNSLENTTSYLEKEMSSLNATVQGLESKIDQLSTEISSLNSTLISLNKTVTNINSTSIPQLEKEISSLNSNISSLKSELSSVNSSVTSLKSTVSSASTLVYVALAAGIIGLIVAIIAVVLVLRKIR